jgi:predicted dienelactone hydrolase/ABC-type amino acid transport substrate-binding protein
MLDSRERRLYEDFIKDWMMRFQDYLLQSHAAKAFWSRGIKSAGLGISLLLGLTGIELYNPKPALPAERIDAIYGAVELTLPVSALETYVNTGQITPELQPYTQFISPETLAETRVLLQQKFTVSPLELARFLDAPIGKTLLTRFSQVLQAEPGQNQNNAQLLRTSLTTAAKNPQGFTVLNLIRSFPKDNLRINVTRLLDAKQELTTLSNYRDAALKAIAQQEQAEMTGTTPVDFGKRLNLQQPGPFQVLRRPLDLSTNRNRQSLLGERIGRRFEVDLYLPQAHKQPAPVVVISHGLGSGRRDFAYLAEHLASHGFAVAVTEHIGSNVQRLQALLDGSLQGSDVSPVEFIDRPRDIQYLLDELQRLSQSDPSLKGRFNLQQVGVMGHSLGGYTSLALAGAEINHPRLQAACANEQLTLNISLVLQCRAKSLPPFSYNLYDPRVKAAMAIAPLTSAILGPENLGEIRIPTMIVSASDDLVAPAIPEQIHPFLWLKTPDKYLAMIVPSGHNFPIGASTPPPQPSPKPTQSSLNELGQTLAGPNPQLAQTYLKALSVAFMQTHLANRPDYRSYLSAAYAQTLSQGQTQGRSSLKLDIVRSLTANQLQQAFGNPPPIPVIPPLPTAAANPTPTTTPAPAVLQNIQQTGILRASLRAETLPFAAVDTNGAYQGYCMNLLTGLANRLQTQLNRPVTLQVATTSTLENRFQIVQDRTVHVECGPNTITRNPLPGTTFSTPFFITGTHFLTRRTPKPTLNPQGNLQNKRVGIFSRTTTETFVRNRYPNAQIMAFQGETARADAFQALNSGQIDALANDGILLISQLERQNLPLGQYTLIPERPLTCDAYGMILPAGDRQWEIAVNQFISSQSAKQIWDKSFRALYPYILLNIDFCADR